MFLTTWQSHSASYGAESGFLAKAIDMSLLRSEAAFDPNGATLTHTDPHQSFDEVKNIFLFEFNLEFAEQQQIFILKCLSTMMFFLVLYIADDRV